MSEKFWYLPLSDDEGEKLVGGYGTDFIVTTVTSVVEITVTVSSVITIGDPVPGNSRKSPNGTQVFKLKK
jgi:hypothetical protein